MKRSPRPAKAHGVGDALARQDAREFERQFTASVIHAASQKLDEEIMKQGKSPKSARQTLDEAISEKDFLATIIKACKLKHLYYYHPYHSDKSVEGWPDIAFILNGVLHLWELKKQKGIVSQSQQDWIDELQTCAGVDARIVRPSDWDDIVKILE